AARQRHANQRLVAAREELRVARLGSRQRSPQAAACGGEALALARARARLRQRLGAGALAARAWSVGRARPHGPDLPAALHARPVFVQLPPLAVLCRARVVRSGRSPAAAVARRPGGPGALVHVLPPVTQRPTGAAAALLPRLDAAADGHPRLAHSAG